MNKADTLKNKNVQPLKHCSYINMHCTLGKKMSTLCFAMEIICIIQQSTEEICISNLRSEKEKDEQPLEGLDCPWGNKIVKTNLKEI